MTAVATDSAWPLATWLTPVLVVLAAALVCRTLLSLIMRAKWRNRFLDRPNARSLHSEETPRVGGIAIMLTVLGSGAGALVLTAQAGDTATNNPGQAAWVLGASCALLSIVGVFDDRMNLPAWIKGGAQLACAITLAFWLPGFADSLTTMPDTGPSPLRDGFWLLLTVAILCWSANLYNFMDGSDGLAASVAVVGFGALGLMALGLFAPAPGLSGVAASATPEVTTGSSITTEPAARIIGLLCLLVAGAAAGFLSLNRPPARVFMGDAGSVPVGFLAGAAGIGGVFAGLWPAWLPAAVFAPFIIDASLTLGRRVLRGRIPWHAHREHAYQQLILRGFSHRSVMLTYACLTAICAIVAGTTRYQNPGVCFVVWTVIICGIACGYFWATAQEPGRGPDEASR